MSYLKSASPQLSNGKILQKKRPKLQDKGYLIWVFWVGILRKLLLFFKLAPSNL